MKQSYKIMILFVCLIVPAFYFYVHHKDSQYGTVIILNGPSGSGKTSIQNAFQHLMFPNFWCKGGIDNFFDHAFPDITPENMNQWLHPNPLRWVETTIDADNKQVVTLYMGDQGNKVVHAMNSAIVAYAKSGCNIIVDYIAYDQAWLTDLKKKLRGIKTYWVAVDISLHILEEREAARATSPAGHARSHYATVYGDCAYNVRVDSSTQTPQEIALQLRDMVTHVN